jgi:hypothetical protein
VADACGAGDEAAAKRSLENLAFAGDSLFTDVTTISALFRATSITGQQPES